MHTLIAFGLFGLAVAAAVWTALVWRGFTQVWLPEELKHAKVAMVEKNLRIDAPLPVVGRSGKRLRLPVVGRPDRVYRLESGLHVPVENKNRDGHWIYDTDIAQLSLQAWLLRQKGMETASFGFVAINSRRSGRRQALRVELLGDGECLRIIQRYLDVIEGRAVPTKSRGGKCNTCGHRSICLE